MRVRGSDCASKIYIKVRITVVLEHREGWVW